MGEHTPTPWKWRNDFNHIQGAPRDGEWYGEAVTNYGGLAKPRTLGVANAAFIVKAVNNHDDLVKALKLARARIEYLGAACTDSKHFQANVETFLPALDEVLAAVGSSSEGAK
ncbi:hypothetical protein IC762_12065 [Bradyrhizobium genosp. L]|uniref:hypothetical protein n=1 Tax=Bradyrhizobium genosp. L TaxID=83637 RepID=UPI0018A2FB7F|nr:hypothetical protein [Bradyrhizobium genosp. L]QPF86979.1 hypothetical protein IC762_12065 [Bradyrhizobium genosp. L]